MILVNMDPIIKSQEEIDGLCPSGISCAELSGECLKCNLNYSCKYGAIYEANCSVMEHIDCIVCKTCGKSFAIFFSLKFEIL